MNRRSFFGRLAGAAAFAKVLPAALARVPAQPEIVMQLVSTPVVAKPLQLKTSWSVEADQYLRAHYDIEVEAQLVEALNRSTSEPL